MLQCLALAPNVWHAGPTRLTHVLSPNARTLERKCLHACLTPPTHVWWRGSLFQQRSPLTPTRTRSTLPCVLNCTSLHHVVIHLRTVCSTHSKPPSRAADLGPLLLTLQPPRTTAGLP